MVVADRKCSIREAYVEAFIVHGKFSGALQVLGEDISTPDFEWSPHLGELEEFAELEAQNFDPFKDEFHHVLKSNDFYFTIAGECIPVNSIVIELSRFKNQAKFEFKLLATGNVDLLCNDAYDSNMLLVVSCVARFKGFAIRTLEEYHCYNSDLALVNQFFHVEKMIPTASDSPVIRKYLPV
jgi:hypothetical protein